MFVQIQRKGHKGCFKQPVFAKASSNPEKTQEVKSRPTPAVQTVAPRRSLGAFHALAACQAHSTPEAQAHVLATAVLLALVEFFPRRQLENPVNYSCQKFGWEVFWGTPKMTACPFSFLLKPTETGCPAETADPFKLKSDWCSHCSLVFTSFPGIEVVPMKLDVATTRSI